MSYSEKISISIRAEVYEIACAIARAMDNDLGGDKSYGPKVLTGPDGKEYMPDTYRTSALCTPEFKQQANAMLGDPVLLHQAVAQDYATRWADLVPPTLEECENFCAGVVVEVPVESSQNESP